MSVSKSANSLYQGQRLKVVLPVSVISESVPIVLWEKVRPYILSGVSHIFHSP